jgi:5'-AMP-activated protein kinase, catalytic alpha subunit
MRPLHNLQFERNIGSGTFGKVRRAVHVPTGKPVAVKVLNKQRINSKKDAARIEREITILKRINHPNLLKLFQLIETQKSYMLITQLV